jgi:hypothetical protein
MRGEQICPDDAWHTKTVAVNDAKDKRRTARGTRECCAEKRETERAGKNMPSLLL